MLGLPVIFANKLIIYIVLADSKSAPVACSQLLVVINNSNPAGGLA